MHIHRLKAEFLLRQGRAGVADLVIRPMQEALKARALTNQDPVVPPGDVALLPNVPKSYSELDDALRILVATCRYHMGFVGHVRDAGLSDCAPVLAALNGRCAVFLVLFVFSVNFYLIGRPCGRCLVIFQPMP